MRAPEHERFESIKDLELVGVGWRGNDEGVGWRADGGVLGNKTDVAIRRSDVGDTRGNYEVTPRMCPRGDNSTVISRI